MTVAEGDVRPRALLNNFHWRNVDQPVHRRHGLVDPGILRMDMINCFAQDWPLGKVVSGDLLVLWGAGAYGFVEASNYNSRPRPVEVLVSGSRADIIRRRESRADLVRGE